MEQLAIICERLARYAVGDARRVSWAAVVVTLLALVIGLPPKVDSNLLNLLPDSEPTVRAIRRINDDEGGLNILSLTLRGEDPKVLDEVLDDLQRRFEALDDVAFAIHEVDPELALQVGLLQFAPDELAELNNRLAGALALGPALNPMVTQRLMSMGPLTERIAKANQTALFGKDPTQGRLVVRPTGTAVDPVFAQRFMTQVDTILHEANPEGRGVEVAWVGGAYRHTVEDVKGIAWDLTWTTGVSGAVVLLVLLVALRSWRSLLIVFPPLLVANAINLAWIKLFLGALNTYTAFGTAMLFGLGIDFAVHLVGRYREERAAGLEVEDAIAEAWRVTGPPCWTAALTSVAGFLSLCVAEFGGFVQLGLVLAGGLLLCLLAHLILLPVLIARFERDAPPLLGTMTVEPPPSTSSYRIGYVSSAVLMLSTVLLGAIGLPHIEFEYDLSQLRRDGLAYDELSDAEQALAREAYSPVVISYAEEAQLDADKALVREAIADGRLAHVSAVMSLRDVLPPDQAARNVQIAELARQMEDPDARYLPAVLQQRLAPVKGLEVRELTRADLPEGVLHLLGASNASIHRMLLLPKGNMWDVREASKLKAELDGLLPGREIAGEHIGVAAMFLIALRDAPRIGGLALVLVLILTWLDLRRPHQAIAAFLSLVLGVAWAGIAMWAFGMKFSMINLAGLPILLGIGVDVVVHLSHRLVEEGPGGIRVALRTTGTAVVVSTLTTMGSFWALTLAGNRGVRSLGQLVVIGLFMVGTMGTLTLISLWSAGWRWTGRAPAQAR